MNNAQAALIAAAHTDSGRLTEQQILNRAERFLTWLNRAEPAPKPPADLTWLERAARSGRIPEIDTWPLPGPDGTLAP